MFVNSPESLALIRRAKVGDREALEALYRRYYPNWLKRWRGKLGAGLRNFEDTEGLVHSALKDAVRDIEDLRDDQAFFAWVDKIIQRKIASKRRRNDRLPLIPLDEVPEPGRKDPLDLPLVTKEEYLRLRKAIDGLARHYSQQMAAVELRYFKKLDITSIAKSLNTSKRSAERFLHDGLALLRKTLGDG